MMKDVHWVFVVCGFLVIASIAGGSSLPSYNQFLVLTWSSMALLAIAIWRMKTSNPDKTISAALMILAAGFSLMFLQLVPLPPSVWVVLGGRGFVVESFEAAQRKDIWLALSLSPEGTRQNIFALLPAVAAFIAMISVSREGHVYLVATIVGLAFIGLLISLFQIGGAAVSGGFVNPNFFAAQLYMSIPFVIALAVRNARRPMWIIAFAIVALCIAGIGQSGSRVGLLIAISVSLASVMSLQNVNKTAGAYGLAGLAVLVVFVLYFGGAGLERVSGLQTAFAARANMFATSLQAMFYFFPAGSGFGSFVPAYQLFETPASVTPNIINHAHNDWVELLLEGGLLMAAIIVAFLRWFSIAFSAVWKSHSEFSKAAAISAVAVMAHSLVDYPLRTPALMVLFACCCGLMLRAAQVTAASKSKWQFESIFTSERALVR